MTGEAGTDEPVVVLESFGPPHERTSPYHLELIRSLPPDVELLYFSWRNALRARYDVFHVHWPEVVVAGRTRIRRLARSVLLLLVLIRLRLRRRALVRTLHNVAPHEPPPFPAPLMVRLTERWTTLWITLSESVHPPAGVPSAMIPHGDFRDRFAAYPPATPTPGRIVHFGRLRPYKGVDHLVEAFEALPGDELSLHIVGQADDRGLEALLRAATERDGRIEVLAGYVDEEVLAREVSAAELVVLPFKEFTNSSTLILGLSLDRPVLVLRTPMTEDLAAEVGGDWVILLDGRLDAASLGAAIEVARRPRSTTRPDLSRRAWPDIGRAHRDAFVRAASLAQSRASTRRNQRGSARSRKPTVHTARKP